MLKSDKMWIYKIASVAVPEMLKCLQWVLLWKQKLSRAVCSTAVGEESLTLLSVTLERYLLHLIFLLSVVIVPLSFCFLHGVAYWELARGQQFAGQAVSHLMTSRWKKKRAVWIGSWCNGFCTTKFLFWRAVFAVNAVQNGTCPGNVLFW